MTATIYIRTYYKDLKWLEYCLRSIHKFVTGFDEIVICIPENQKRHLDPWGLTQERIVTCPIYANDYNGQQISKLESWKHTESDHILFVDSDCLFTTSVNVKEYFFSEGKPIIYMRSWEHAGDAQCWRPETERLLGHSTDYEFMCRLPLMYERETLKQVYEQLISIEVIDHYTRNNHHGFSEFNILGSFAHKNHPEKYKFIDVTKDEQQPMVIRQFWSWCKEEEFEKNRQEMEEILR